MDTKLQTGLLLILGPIVSMVGWIFLYPADPTDPAAVWASKLIADPNGTAMLGMIIGFGGTLAMLIGLFNVCRRMIMANTVGSAYASVATILVLVTATMMICLFGFELEVHRAADVRAAGPLIAIAYAINSTMSGIIGLAVLLLAIGIALQKNYHIVIAGAGVLGGVVMIAATVAEKTEWQGIGWPLMLLFAVAMGVMRIRASE